MKYAQFILAFFFTITNVFLLVLAQRSLRYICGHFVLKFPSSEILVGIYRTRALLLRRQQLRHTAIRK